MTIRGQEPHMKRSGTCGYSLWGEFTQNWTEQGLSSYKPFAFTFGRDRRVGHWVLGLAGQYVHGNVRSDAATLHFTQRRQGQKL